MTSVKQPKIIFEDESLLVLDKPAGMIVHEGVKVDGETLVDFIASHLGESPLKDRRWGLLHRLDRDTSGVVLVAKTIPMFDFMKTAFKERRVKKEYLALVHGAIEPADGVIRIPLARSLGRRTAYSPSSTGRFAETEYHTLQKYSKHSYLQVLPKTGRTHQIRVHLASIGNPIVGDTLYGKSEPGLGRHFLHASRIEFASLSGDVLVFESSIPSELMIFLDGLK